MVTVTSDAPINPRILEASEALTDRLVALVGTEGEQIVRVEVITRGGVPRKWKVWAEPDWVEPKRHC